MTFEEWWEKEGRFTAERPDIAPGLAQETMYVNDEQGRYNETPEERWTRVRTWAESQIKRKPEPETPPQEGTR